jgi:hypothetical protein
MKPVFKNVHLVIQNVDLVPPMKPVTIVLESELTHLIVSVQNFTMNKVLNVFLVVTDVKSVMKILKPAMFVLKTELIHQLVIVQPELMTMIKTQLVQNVVVIVLPVAIIPLPV